MTVPLFEEDEAIGFFFISISREALEVREMEDPTRSPLSMITFNDMGEIVTSEQEQGLAEVNCRKHTP